MVDDPAVDERHHLVARRRRQEAVRPHGASALVGHAQQQLIVRPGGVGCGEGQDELRVKVQTPLVDRLAQLPRDANVRKAAHDADVALLVHLDAVTAAVLGGLAGGLGRRQHVRQLVRGAIEQGDADADRDGQGYPDIGHGEPLGARAQRLRETLGVIHLRGQQHHEAIAGDA